MSFWDIAAKSPCIEKNTKLKNMHMTPSSDTVSLFPNGRRIMQKDMWRGKYDKPFRMGPRESTETLFIGVKAILMAV